MVVIVQIASAPCRALPFHYQFAPSSQLLGHTSRKRYGISERENMLCLAIQRFSRN